MSKPNAILAQSGRPAAVIYSNACSAIQELIRSGKVSRVISATNGILGVLEEDLFDAFAEKPKTVEALI
jgi:6-phosphofructokinase 1